MSVTQKVRTRLRKLGYDVARFTPESHPLARRGRLLRSLQIDVVLDVGANTGQYAQGLRRDQGFAGRICSFEPLAAPFQVLRKRAAGDPHWSAFNFGLGDVAGNATINVAGNSESSSLLDMLPRHLEAAPDSRFVGTEDIEIKTLDEVFSDLCASGERVFLKIDTQGFEGRVLRGADRSLVRIDTVQVEMSLTPLYVGEPTFVEMCQLLVGEGYTMVGLEPGFADPRTGQLLQADGIFHRAEDRRIG
jgi:FkbM family methyltransferase